MENYGNGEKNTHSKSSNKNVNMNENNVNNSDNHNNNNKEREISINLQALSYFFNVCQSADRFPGGGSGRNAIMVSFGPFLLLNDLKPQSVA